jgi:predicted nuclease of predicted toxin-antitoxin system
MIIIDNNQIILATIFATLRDGEVDEDKLRHVVLNTYRMYRNKFRKEYGELVIANDSKDYWRKDIFPQYKANRKKDQKKSKFDWPVIYEVRDVFPFRNLTVEHAEADDIIAVLVKKFHATEKIMIVSNDKDFQQLQRFENVAQYSPMKKKLLVCEDPEKFLLDHIIKGDVSDGIPNILSVDDVLVDPDKRQTPCGTRKMEQIKVDLTEWSKTPNWDRNNQLINMQCIPEWIEQHVLNEYNKPLNNDANKVLSYFIQKRLRNLMENIQEFV